MINCNNNINSSAIACLSLLIPYNTYVNYAMVAIDLAHVATYQRTISQEINTAKIYGGTLQDECESDGNNIENVMPNNQMDEYDGNTIKGLGISMNNNARLAKLSDFVYIQGMVNNINNSLFRSSQRLMRYNVSFTIYHETEDSTKNIAVYLDKDYIREECHPSDTNLNNHTVYYSSYNVIQHRVKCSHCSFVKLEYHQWIHKNAETYCSKCNFVSAVQPWGDDEITG